MLEGGVTDTLPFSLTECLLLQKCKFFIIFAKRPYGHEN